MSFGGIPPPLKEDMLCESSIEMAAMMVMMVMMVVVVVTGREEVVQGTGLFSGPLSHNFSELHIPHQFHTLK